MIAYIAGLAAVGFIGSFFLQGRSAVVHTSAHYEDTARPDVRDYEVPPLAEEEKELELSR